MRIISFGELLWDVINDQEFLGGAPVNFSAASLRLGAKVDLVSAVGDDQRGARALTAVQTLGLSVSFIATISGHPTGIARVVSGESGHAAYRFNHPAAYDFLRVDSQLTHPPAPDWLYFGTLTQTSTPNEAALDQVIAASPSARRFYDMNLRDGHWNLALVERLSAHASVLKLNEHEAETLFRLTHPSQTHSLHAFCAAWSHAYDINIICITLGAQGCAIWRDGALREFPGFPVQVADTIGSGDAFSAAFLHGLNENWPLDRTAAFANALGAIVASRPGATPNWRLEECDALIRESALNLPHI